MSVFKVFKISSMPSQIRGATLLLSLTMLTLVMMFVMNGMETVNLQEKMATHSYERSLGMQSAEWAVRLGEEVVEQQFLLDNNGFPAGKDNLGDPTPGENYNNCTDGLCVAPDYDSDKRWKDESFTGWKTVTGFLDGKAEKIEYFIEFLGEDFACTTEVIGVVRDCKRYRVTARSTFGDGRTKVMLQSLYATQ